MLHAMSLVLESEALQRKLERLHRVELLHDWLFVWIACYGQVTAQDAWEAWPGVADSPEELAELAKSRGFVVALAEQPSGVVELSITG